MKPCYYRYSILVLSIVLMWGCEPKPKPIDYGKEICSFCSMTIVDKQHAAQLVTKKGRVYSYDAIECMMQSSELNKIDDVAILLCNDYNDPGMMIDATQAFYLISEAVPSPMGANLSGFRSREAAYQIEAGNAAEYLDWNSLRKNYQ